MLKLLRQQVLLLQPDHRIHVIHLPETPKMVMATLQDTIILPMTQDLDLPHIKEWVLPAIPPHQGTAGNTLPSTDPLVPKVTQVPVPGQGELVPTTTTPDKALPHAGGLRGSMTRTQDPMQVLRCTAEGGTARGIRPGQGIQVDLPYQLLARRDNQLKQTTIPVVSSIQINSRREELDLQVPLVQDPDPQVLQDHPAQGSCRGPRSRAVPPTPLSCEPTPPPLPAPWMTLFPWPSPCRESLTHMDILEAFPLEVDRLEAPCLLLEDRCTLEVLQELLTNLECPQAHSPSTHQGLL